MEDGKQFCSQYNLNYETSLFNVYKPSHFATCHCHLLIINLTKEASEPLIVDKVVWHDFYLGTENLLALGDQEASLCAQHAVNMLLQGSYFTAVDLAEIASDIDSREGRVLNEQDMMSHNVDDSGYFSLQVIAEALKVFNLELIPLNNPRAAAYRDDPTLGQAYICNLNEHWFAVRRLGFQWFTLNSLLPTPRLISDTYLSLFFAQLINDGYSIFVVEGVLPLCTADEQLSQFPVDPALAGMNDSFRDNHSKNPGIARSEAVSSEEVCSGFFSYSKFHGGVLQTKDDEDLRLAIELSRQTVKENSSYKEALCNSLTDAQQKNILDENDEELYERQFQKAIQMSLESVRERCGVESSKATSSSAESNKALTAIKETKESISQIPRSEEIRRKEKTS
ncbi:Ataxin-3 [Dirofilaria immitis]|nr:Ataxin-3 [Dirofilaria immitis]